MQKRRQNEIYSISFVGAGPTAIACFVAVAQAKLLSLKEIILFDPQGLCNSSAFATSQEDVITNTSAGVNSLYVDRLEDFCEWLSEIKGLEVEPCEFVSRSLVGEYLIDRFHASAIKLQRRGVQIRFEKKKVVRIDIKAEPAKYILRSQNDTHSKFVLIDCRENTHYSDAVIIATGVIYSNPWHDLDKIAKYVSNPYNGELDAMLGNSVHALVAGSNLSAIDATLRILRASDASKVTMASPSGLLPSVRNEISLPKTKGARSFAIEKFKVIKSSELPKKMILAALNDLRKVKSLRHIREVYRDKKHSIELLEQDIERCKRGQNGWEALIGEMIEVTNEIWPNLSNADQIYLLNEYKFFIERYVSAIPLRTAKELLIYAKEGRLSVVALNEQLNIKIEKNGLILGVNALKDQIFDVLVNGTGVDRKKSASDEIFSSMNNTLFQVNEFYGLKIDINSCRVPGLTGETRPLYIAGPPTFGNLPVTNYLRTSVLQATKIATDLEIESNGRFNH